MTTLDTAGLVHPQSQLPSCQSHPAVILKRPLSGFIQEAVSVPFLSGPVRGNYLTACQIYLSGAVKSGQRRGHTFRKMAILPHGISFSSLLLSPFSSIITENSHAAGSSFVNTSPLWKMCRACWIMPVVTDQRVLMGWSTIHRNPKSHILQQNVSLF